VIQVTRVLTFEEYVASNRIALLNSTLARRLQTLMWLNILPIVSAATILLTLWELNDLRAGSGNSSAFIFWCGVLGASIMSCLYPWIFRRKLTKMYQRQELDRPWTIRIDPTGIQSTLPGKFDTRFEWAYFDRQVETSELFTLVQSKRLIFITLPKSSLSPDDQIELRKLLAAHIHKNPT